MIETEFSDEVNQTYSSMALNTITSVFSMAKEKIGDYVWSGAGTQTGSQQTPQSSATPTQFSFGERNPAAQEEIDRFAPQESYLDTLKDCFKSLSLELLQLIDCSEESKKTYQALSENF